jgi:dUTP pyrophosphatase
MIKFFIEPGYDVKAPVRDYGNAGVDVFIPNATDAFVKAFNDKNLTENAVLDFNEEGKPVIKIMPHGRANIPSGLRSFIPANVALEAHNKSGIATKYGLVFGASTVDANYQGIIHISLINTTNKVVELPLGMKAVQFIPRVIDTSPIAIADREMTLEEFYKDFEFTNRGEGAFGSTGV